MYEFSKNKMNLDNFGNTFIRKRILVDLTFLSFSALSPLEPHRFNPRLYPFIFIIRLYCIDPRFTRISTSSIHQLDLSEA